MAYSESNSNENEPTMQMPSKTTNPKPIPPGIAKLLAKWGIVIASAGAGGAVVHDQVRDCPDCPECPEVVASADCPEPPPCPPTVICPACPDEVVAPPDVRTEFSIGQAVVLRVEDALGPYLFLCHVQNDLSCVDWGWTTSEALVGKHIRQLTFGQ